MSLSSEVAVDPIFKLEVENDKESEAYFWACWNMAVENRHNFDIYSFFVSEMAKLNKLPNGFSIDACKSQETAKTAVELLSYRSNTNDWKDLIILLENQVSGQSSLFSKNDRALLFCTVNNLYTAKQEEGYELNSTEKINIRYSIGNMLNYLSYGEGLNTSYPAEELAAMTVVLGNDVVSADFSKTHERICEGVGRYVEDLDQKFFRKFELSENTSEPRVVGDKTLKECMGIAKNARKIVNEIPNLDGQERQVASLYVFNKLIENGERNLGLDVEKIIRWHREEIASLSNPYLLPVGVEAEYRHNTNEGINTTRAVARLFGIDNVIESPYSERFVEINPQYPFESTTWSARLLQEMTKVGAVHLSEIQHHDKHEHFSKLEVTKGKSVSLHINIGVPKDMLRVYEERIGDFKTDFESWINPKISKDMDLIVGAFILAYSTKDRLNSKKTGRLWIVKGKENGDAEITKKTLKSRVEVVFPEFSGMETYRELKEMQLLMVAMFAHKQSMVGIVEDKVIQSLAAIWENAQKDLKQIADKHYDGDIENLFMWKRANSENVLKDEVIEKKQIKKSVKKTLRKIAREVAREIGL